MIDRILLAFDGSDTSKAIVPYVSWLAKSIRAKVTLLSAAPSRSEILRAISADVDGDDISGASYRFADPERLDMIKSRLHSGVGAMAEREAESMRKDGVDATTQIVEGDPAEIILAESAKSPGAIVAMATHGRVGVQRWFVGSVTTKVASHSRYPVLTVRAHEDAPAPSSSDEIIVPLDGSKRSEAALPYATDLAAKLNVPIRILRSAELSGLGYGFMDDGPDQYADLVASAQESARQYVSFIAEDLRSQGVRDVVETIVDNAADEGILQTVGLAGAKLVVMASHGRTGFNRMVLGSVTDRVIRHSSGPVLIVPSIQE